MSRHRKAYDDDDLYDDYGDEEDDYYEDEEWFGQEEAASQARNDVDPAVCLSFVMESLGKTHVSELRVSQMLTMYDYDVEKTISFFLNEQSAKPAAPKPQPAKGSSLGSKSSAAVAATKKAAGTKESSPVVEPTIDAPAPSSSLLTDSAPLSDDEFEDRDESSAQGQGQDQGAQQPIRLTMVVAGHVDAGKSTLVGNLLFKTGGVAQRTVHKFQKESAEAGKGSFALAWVMDEGSSEREHGVTISVAERTIVTGSRVLTILDAPGHRDYIPSMISGASTADVALLVIPASVGEFEASMGERAQTREHAVLLKALGVRQVLVAVNKMDSKPGSGDGWSQARYEHIVEQVGALLSEVHFGPSAVRFVPVSGLTGENLVSLSEGCALRRWYAGPTLLEAVQSFRQPRRRVHGAPFRAVVSSVQAESSRGCDVRVTVLQGRLLAGRGVGLASTAGAATVKKIVLEDGSPVDRVEAGVCAVLTLQDRSGRSGEEMALREGMVLCKGPPLARPTRLFKASIHTLPGLPVPIIPGSAFELYLHGQEALCRVERIYTMGTGGTKARHPKSVPGGRSAYVLVRLDEVQSPSGVCIEPHDECPALARFALRARGVTAAVGVCRRVKPL